MPSDARNESTPDPSARIGVRPATQLMRDVLDISREFQAHMRTELTVNSTDLDAMEHLIAYGPMGPTDLAKRLGLSTAAATTVVDRLVALGHAERTQHPTDRRGVVVVPSLASVAKAMGEIMPMVRGIDAALDGFTDEEQATITRYLERVVVSYRSRLPSPGAPGG